MSRSGHYRFAAGLRIFNSFAALRPRIAALRPRIAALSAASSVNGSLPRRDH
jgi:hypothetical protein